MPGYARRMTTSPPVSRLAGTAPFAGRERELAALGQSAAEARRGEPRVTVIEGQPGMGKSALLTEFDRQLPDAFVIRASGAEAEMRLPYGLITQLTASASRPGSPRTMAATPPSSADPLAVGADLATELSHVAPPGRLTVMIIDDAHWADPGSAAALLHALRRMHSGALMAVLAARPVEFGQLGAGSWSRFVAGDHRAHRLRLDGFSVAEVQSLAQLITAAELPAPAAARLVHCTGGRPGYCRAILSEAGAQPAGADPLLAGTRPAAFQEETYPVPRDVAAGVRAQAALLSADASELLDAAAVLGRSSSVAVAASLAGLPDPAAAVGEIAAAGLAAESLRSSGIQFEFADPLTQRAVMAQITPARRRQLHQRAARLTRQDENLRHRFAAATGFDPALSADLEAAGHAAARRAAAGRYKKSPADVPQEPTGYTAPGQPASAQAADLLVQAATLTPDTAASDRLILDALEVLIRAGDARRAGALADRAAGASPGPRRDALLGWLDLLAGRFAQAADLLSDSWQAHDPATEPITGARAAAGLLWCSLQAGRFGEAVAMGERAVQAAGQDPAARPQAVSDLALALAFDQRGPEALACFGPLAACAADVPLRQTGTLVARGIVRVIAGDLDPAIADLTAVLGRLRSGTGVPHAGLAMSMLAEAEFRLGAWDDAASHAELAVTLTREAGCDGDLSLVHATASLVPARRGDWVTAAAHVDAAGVVARTSGAALGTVAWATARACLAMARADHAQVLRAVTTVRDTGAAAAVIGRVPLYPWPLLEAEALIARGDLAGAGAALNAIGAARPAPAGSSAAAGSSVTAARVAAGRLRGLLAAALGDTDGAARALAAARGEACAAALPVQLAQLELATGQALRQSARRPEAIAYLRAARARFTQAGAVPAVSACDQELAACGVQIGRDPSPATLGLTATELAVARLVAVGHSNRQAAAELYISIKGIEFHLRNIYAKLGIRSRRELAERLSDSTETLSQINTAELVIPPG
jgi:DNA-binding CsgD family transcriptional regulator